jgi:hypothetical protein
VAEMVRNARAFDEQVRRQTAATGGPVAEVELNWDEHLAFDGTGDAPDAT